MAREHQVYLHVPWCRRHCPYCDFAVAVQATIPHKAYADAVLWEWEARAHELRGRMLRSIYLGGGTPGLWDPEEGARVIDRLLRDAGDGTRVQPREITIELNPELLDDGVLRAWRAAGVDRVSLGVQSFDDAVLAQLGRGHDGRQARRAIEQVRAAGFSRLSVDLIIGAPAATVASTAADAAAVVEMELTHVSTYELTWEPGTGFDARRKRGRLVPKPDEDVEHMLLTGHDALRAAGLVRYEVSSWARPGDEAVHNSGYWEGIPYTGLGVGAHSLVLDGQTVRRGANGRAVRDYLANPRGTNWEDVSWSTFWFERAMASLRTAAGWDLAPFCAALGQQQAAWMPLVERWVAQGLGHVEASRFIPNDAGLWMGDALASDVLDVMEIALGAQNG